MNPNCQTIVFSNKAYNAIIDETFKREPIETGGILLGHILDNGIWIVMEVLPPGINSIHQYAYFEYDDNFVNYLAQSVATKYKIELNLLGLWHRHPGSMDVFSGTDDGTNLTFARLNSKGAISGLVNVDPKFRLTMRHVSAPLKYEIVEFEVGDDLIPAEYFQLKHFPENGLHPSPSESKKALETVIEKESETKSSKDCKTTESLRICCDKLKYYILLPICVLSLLLSVLLVSLCADKHLGNNRLVSDRKAVQQEQLMDEAAFQKAVAAYICFVDDTIKNDSILKATALETFRVTYNKGKTSQQQLKQNSIIQYQEAISAYINCINDSIKKDSLINYAALNNSCQIYKTYCKVDTVQSLPKAPEEEKVSNKIKYIRSFSLVLSILILILSASVFCCDFVASFIRRRNLPWYLKDKSQLLADEYELKGISTICEKSIENDIVSFLLETNKHYKNFEDALAYQIVYPQDFLKARTIRIYLITPSFKEIIANDDKIDLLPLKKDNQNELYYEVSITSGKGHALEAVYSFYKWLGLK